MPFVYDKLFELMRVKGITTYQIRKDNIISQSALQYLHLGKNVSTATLDKLCKVLDCQPGDIMEYVDDE